MVTSQESSPSALFNNSPSPSAGHDFYNGKIPDGAAPNQPWTYFGYPQNGLSHLSVPTMPTSQTFHGIGPPCVLLIHPTPLKSRVETQIPIKLSLFPLPLGIKRLHLPTHTISKPKLLAKPPLERSPDTLELYTTLVCTSAMRNPEYRRRAFARAAAASRESDNEEPSSEHTDEDDENKPLNGGEVKICAGCITRERKRAARKKIKKVEEEESWHKDEAKRVVVFNAQEIKDWQPPTSQTPSDATGDRPEPFIPEGAMQVDAPMRIACYCRHQNEKLGFQVIFTIKDYQDRLLAQEITNSIMITDDHKTHSLPAVPTRTSLGSDGLFSGSGAFPMDNTFNMSTGPVVATAPPNASPPSSDLQSLQNLNMQFQNPSDLAASHASQTTSATITPRTMSRQTSPSSGPSSKKRKASGVPSGLAMTKLEAPEGGVGQGIPPAPISATASTAPSPYSSNLQSFSPSDQPFGQPPIQQYNASPLTPNSNDQFSNANRSRSMENLAMQHPMFSAPPSSHPSRTSSPNGLRNSVQVYQQQQAQFAQAVASGLYSMPLSLNPHRPPTIHKLIPNEGPRAGGIEVTCLGSGFCQGLEVMFGDSKATTTTYWGETSLVCLLPPSAFAGTVPVTFKHQHQPTIPPHFPPIPKQQAHFKYVDDDEQQIIRTALAVLGHKMTGKMEDVRDLARRIVGDGNSSWGASTTGAGQNHTMSSFNSASFGVDVEATLLRCLDLIDLDDSPNMPRLNLRRASGQTMLHLACSLGLNRFVAALLARGANPEPRDKGGFTPMHFAALHNHPQIVRRLMLSGADPTLRSLQGYTPSDMATSEEVLRAARRIEHHRRTRSASSLKSRASSVTSLPSVWEPASTPSLVPSSSSEESDGDKEYEDDDADAPDDDAFWMRSTRRPSAPKLRKESIVDEKDPILELPPNIGPTGGFVSPAAAMTAFRDQLTAHIQHLQHTMHLNLPNLPQLPPLPPMPTFPMMPALPDYQAYLPTAPMVRRIGNLVGNRGDNATQQDYKWWDLFSGNVPAAPPAYEDIFPEDSALTKQTSAVQAAADTVADNKCAELFDQTESTTSAESSKSAQKRPVKLDTVRIGQKHVITKEQQDQLRLAHAEKVKRLSRDRNLFFIWVCLGSFPLLAQANHYRFLSWSSSSSRCSATDSRRSCHALRPSTYRTTQSQSVRSRFLKHHSVHRCVLFCIASYSLRVRTGAWGLLGYIYSRSAPSGYAFY
jgi:hypothetical protein